MIPVGFLPISPRVCGTVHGTVAAHTASEKAPARLGSLGGSMQRAPLWAARSIGVRVEEDDCVDGTVSCHWMCAANRATQCLEMWRIFQAFGLPARAGPHSWP
ncbi:unnamed protein product [Prorocentrum cordatum]|uniref:Uncharacterized protein n=1 Tax=Prorocentrum cordatum TaxID=2364126 RepID=A0ABN9SRS5_9DINO|nr:unnamed protein product [Polarella glacialis]